MTDAQLTESRFEVNGITLNVATAGGADRPTVLLLHGFPDRWQLWRHQLPVLAAAGYHVIAPDLRGFGDSDRPAEVSDYAMPGLVGDVTGLLDALEVDTAAVVGHDWGAGLAWNVAMTRPERVEKLTVISVGHGGTATAAGLRQREMSWYMLWFLFPGVAEQVLPREDWAFYRRWAWAGAAAGTDPDADRQVADLTRPGALTAGLNWYRANIRPERFVPPENLDQLMTRTPRRPPPLRSSLVPRCDAHGADQLKAHLPRVSCPTMGVWSDQDMALGEVQMTASSAFVDAPWRYERIEGCDHWVPVHAPDRLNALLLDFLGPAE